LDKNSNYEAGESLAKVFKNIAISTEKVEHERLIEMNGNVNWTLVLIGMNDQLLITNEKDFCSCLHDSSQVQTIVKALILAINHKDVIHGIEDLVKLIEKLPGTKKDCMATVKNYGEFFLKIYRAYKKDQSAFFGIIESNIEKQALKVTGALRGFFKGLKNGQDYQAGRSLGLLIQLVLKGIIN